MKHPTMENGVSDLRRRRPLLTKARDILNYEPTIDVRDGIEDVVNWIRAKVNLSK